MVEEGTGRPVAGARISFGTRRKDEPNGASSGHAESGQDGSFQLAALPSPGYLIVLAPSEDFVYQSIGGQVVREGRPGGRRFYAHAIVPLDPKPDRDGPEVAVPLRRGVTVKGRVIGPDDRPVPSAAMIGRVFLAPTPGAWLSWRFSQGGRVRDGRFEVHGLDPDAEVPIHFLEPKGKLGATVRLSGKSGSERAGDRPTRALRHGQGPAGRPHRQAGRQGHLSPDLDDRHARGPSIGTGTARRGARRRGRPAADRPAPLRRRPRVRRRGPDRVPRPDPRRELSASSSGPRGGPHSFRKDFTVKPGETVDLGDIPIEKPPG